MLSLGRNRVPVEIRTLMMVDSLEMTQADRVSIAKNVVKAKEDKIIITHGTDAMVKTAQLLAREVKDKTIVLVGAMIPYKFGSSDGLFNFGAALAFSQTLPTGVYIAMNGQYFTHDNCRKNTKTGYFETLR
ncbi:asparaginase [Elysia marginata]|uniref:Asparaginase n=1 Tax=Elysia marginata TaxID=1093978 RepID=A0AAV4FRP5_9GAST|nr:asparaginase [Elysia marginata]